MFGSFTLDSGEKLEPNFPQRDKRTAGLEWQRVVQYLHFPIWAHSLNNLAPEDPHFGIGIVSCTPPYDLAWLCEAQLER